MPTARAVRTWRVHLTRCNNHQDWLLKELDTAIATRDAAAVYGVADDDSWAAFDMNAEKGLRLIVGWADIADGAIVIYLAAKAGGLTLRRDALAR